MRIVAVGFAAAADGQLFTVDRPTHLYRVATTATKTVVSFDPSSTIANVINLPPSGVNQSLVYAATGSTVQFDVAYDLQLGEQLYISVGAAGQVLLFFRDPT